MADEPSKGKTVCLYAYEYFVTLHVTSQTTQEEVQNVNIRRASLPTLSLPELGPTTETRLGTSFVSLDSKICCIACPRRAYETSNVVKVFDPRASELKFEYPFPNMKQARFLPAVTAIRGVVYVFGGVVRYKQNGIDYIWAECLDTNQPKDKQEWVALNPPSVALQEVSPYAVPFGHNQILIFGCNIAQNSVLYNLEDGSWNDQYIFDRDDSYLPTVTYPVYVERDNTMYWLSGRELYAFDLNTKEFTHDRVCNSVLSDMREHQLEDSSLCNGLMHLKDDVFCFFTMASRLGSVNRILECTKFRVTKRFQSIQIDVFGYQSYDGGLFRNLLGSVSIGSCVGGSMEPPTKKHKHEDDKD